MRSLRDVGYLLLLVAVACRYGLAHPEEVLQPGRAVDWGRPLSVDGIALDFSRQEVLKLLGKPGLVAVGGNRWSCFQKRPNSSVSWEGERMLSIEGATLSQAGQAILKKHDTLQQVIGRCGHPTSDWTLSMGGEEHKVVLYSRDEFSFRVTLVHNRLTSLFVGRHISFDEPPKDWSPGGFIF